MGSQQIDQAPPTNLKVWLSASQQWNLNFKLRFDSSLLNRTVSNMLKLRGFFCGT